MRVPILDDAYMQRRASQRHMQAMMESYSGFFGVPISRPTYDAPDTTKSLRELYATGKLTFEQFEARLEKVL